MTEAAGRRMRILYYVEALDIGGANQTALTVALAMHRKGHEVFFASLDGPLRERLAEEGIPHIPVETRARHPSGGAAAVLRRVIARERIDRVCPNGRDCFLDALLAAIPLGVPVIPTFSGIYAEHAHPRVPRAIVVCAEYRDALVRSFRWRPEALDLLMNRIDTDRFRPGLDGGPFRHRFGLEDQTPLVLMACRFDRLKMGGVRYLLEAVPGLGRLVPEARVLLAGEGEESAEVAERAAAINQEAGCRRVILAGKVLEMETAFNAADVVVGNGARSGLEGAACGRPVVSVGDSGLGGVLAPGTIEDFAYYNFDKGRVFDGTTTRDPRALAGELCSLLRDAGRRRELGEFGREFSVARLGIGAGGDRLEKILLSAEPRTIPQRLIDAKELARGVVSDCWHAGKRKLRRILSSDTAPPASSGSVSAGGRRFLRDSATTFLTGAFALCVGTVQAAVVARILGPEGKGALTAALLVPQLLITLVPLGINWSATYYLGKGTLDRASLVRNVLTVLLLLSGAGIFLSLAADLVLRRTLLPGVPVPAFLLAVLTVPTQIGLLSLSGFFRGEMRIGEANRIDASRTGLMFLGILLALGILRLGVVGVILSQLAAEILVVIVAFRRLGGVPARPLIQREVLKPLMQYGLKVYSFTILMYLNYRFDLFLVRSLLDLRQTGLYSTAVSLAEILWMVPSSLGWVLFPNIASSKGDDRDRLTLTVCRNAFWLMLALCAVMALGRNLILRVFFGESFLAAAPALLAILPGILAMAVQLVLGSSLSGRGHPLPVTLGAAFGLAANVGLNLLWIPRYGIVGASLASSVSYSVVALVVVVAYLRISGTRFRDAFLLRREDWGRVAGIFARAREAAA